MAHEQDSELIIRTTVMLPERLDKALRQLAAEGNRPLSRQVRQALEEHVERETKAAA
jgi:predicted transcriptional regulator